jgi:hypothetical protein
MANWTIKARDGLETPDPIAVTAAPVDAADTGVEFVRSTHVAFWNTTVDAI